MQHLSLCSTKKNSPFPSSKTSHFQNEAKCKTFLVKIPEFYLHWNKKHFHKYGFALSLALKQRLGATQMETNALNPLRGGGGHVLVSYWVLLFVILVSWK